MIKQLCLVLNIKTQIYLEILFLENLSLSQAGLLLETVQSISDSNSDFAQTVKLVVNDLIEEGKTEEEIYSFMAEKYGDWIIYKPQLNKQNFMLWFLPYAFLIGGGLIIFYLIRKKREKA